MIFSWHSFKIEIQTQIYTDSENQVENEYAGRSILHSDDAMII